MPEWRKDPILDRWVVIASERGKRPKEYKVRKEEKNKGGECPLCEHHEVKTPPEILAYRENGSHRDSPGWWVRVVPNKFPAVKIEGQNNIKNFGLYKAMDGVGAHEVVIENPEHDKNMEDFNEYQIQEVIRAWRDRSLDLRKDYRFRYIQIFKNFGSIAGASLDHAHSQIIVTPMVPEGIKRKLDGMTEHARLTGRCILCEKIDQELKLQNRVIIESSKFVGIAPFASRFPFETWIIPREHQSDFGYLREDQIADLAYVLRTILKKLSVSLGQPPFNMVINTVPVNEYNEKLIHFHWHIEILPRLTVAAGFELGTGFYINPTPPEIAAAELRDTVVLFNEQYYHKREEVGSYV